MVQYLGVHIHYTLSTALHLGVLDHHEGVDGCSEAVVVGLHLVDWDSGWVLGLVEHVVWHSIVVDMVGVGNSNHKEFADGIAAGIVVGVVDLEVSCYSALDDAD